MSKTTNYAGIDYGLGKSNISDTGIRYGVLSAHSVASWIYDAVELNYIPYCPECISELKPEIVDDEFTCPYCERTISSEDCYGDTPSSQTYDEDGITFELLENNEIFIFNSPYVTNAQFCSPCFPGAGNLDTPCLNGPLTYCLPLDWFESDRPCPYADNIQPAPSKAE